MTEYRCLVASGERRATWRRVEATSADAAAAAVVASGQVPLDIRSGAVGLIERMNQQLRIGGGVGLGEQAFTMGQLATLVRSGLPVDRSLDLLRDQAPRARQRAMFHDLLQSVRAGEGLAGALAAQGGFPGYVVGVVRSAERSGQLGHALTTLAERLSTMSRTRRQLITAMTYPAAVLTATLMALILVLTLVVPQFAPIFAGEEARLPTLTRAVLWLSATVDRYGWMLAALAGLAIVAVTVATRAAANDPRFDAMRTRIPGMALRDQYLAAQFTGLLGMLIANGVPAVAAVALAGGATSSRRWRDQVGRVEMRVREGERLSRALAETRFVPGTAIRLIEVGERTGTLAQTCLRASEILSEASTARIDRVVTLANPIAIVTLGGIVAMLVGGVMLGIFALGDFAG